MSRQGIAALKAAQVVQAHAGTEFVAVHYSLTADRDFHDAVFHCALAAMIEANFSASSDPGCGSWSLNRRAGSALAERTFLMASQTARTPWANLSGQPSPPMCMK